MPDTRPPRDVQPELLFRQLCTFPRLVAPIAHRLAIAPDVGLHVRALLEVEDVAAIYDPSVTSPHPDITAGRHASQLVAAALCDERGCPMLTAAQTGMLVDTELYPLAGAVKAAVDRISPALWRSDIEAWRDRLRLGAQHLTNVSTVVTMAESSDLATYYGGPLRLLTTGHRLAYFAARWAYDQMQK